MKTLFETSSVEEIKQRIAGLKPESQRLWGKMDVAQALASQFEMEYIDVEQEGFSDVPNLGGHLWGHAAES